MAVKNVNFAEMCDPISQFEKQCNNLQSIYPESSPYILRTAKSRTSRTRSNPLILSLFALSSIHSCVLFTLRNRSVGAVFTT